VVSLEFIQRASYSTYPSLSGFFKITIINLRFI
jgi:hypothetical protein